MLKSLLFLCITLSSISAEIVDIHCRGCTVSWPLPSLSPNSTWNFLCDRTCTRISVFDDHIPRFPRELFVTQPHLDYLSVDGTTGMKEIVFGDFFNAANLHTVFMAWNDHLTTLGENCFWGAFELQYLELPLNDISVIHSGAFNGLENLIWLSLNRNKLTRIEASHFRRLPNLQEVFMSFAYESFQQIDSEAFINNKKLVFVSAFSNNLNEVDLLFPHLNVGQMNFENSNITKFSLRSTETEMPEHPFLELQLENNRLSGLYIQNNFPIRMLRLYGNPISNVYDLPVLPLLEELNVGFCDFEQLDGQRFADRYPNLKYLILQGMNLTSFDNVTFSGLDQLETLLLNENLLTELNFPVMKSLLFLKLDSNSLTEFPYADDVRATFPVLTNIGLWQNDFDPDYYEELVAKLKKQGVEIF